MSQVGVIFGGPSPEHDISILTGLQAARAIAQGQPVVSIYWTKQGRWLRVPSDAEAEWFLDPDSPGASELDLGVPGGFVERRRRKADPLPLDAVLNCCHGGPGEDGTLGGLLALAGIPTSGPSPQASALVMDKLAVAAVANQIGVPTIDTMLVDGPSVAVPSAPWVAKPRFGGSSIGVEAGVEDLDTVRALGRTGVGSAGMLVQPFLSGWRDLNVSVRTHPSLEVSAIERPLRDDGSIYGYADKYLVGGPGMDASPRELPAQIPDHIAKQLTAHAVSLVAELALTGAPRLDFLWDGADRLVLCEVNAIPGAWANHLWVAAGVPRDELYKDLLDEARRTARPPQWSPTSDGRALRMSGSIASKLS